MASRPIFVANLEPSQLVKEIPLTFPWNPGFSSTQKKKNVHALHEAAYSQGLSPILEVSTKSEEKLGQRLSAFNLKINTSLGDISIECAFQGSKVFENGGPYTDLYSVDSRSAKRDERLKNSGRLIGFDFFGDEWPLEPRTGFYDWLYLSALRPHKEFLTRLFEYKGFSDIEFNPDKSINCQARTCALLVSLLKMNILDAALHSKQSFIKTLESASHGTAFPAAIQHTIVAKRPLVADIFGPQHYDESPQHAGKYGGESSYIDAGFLSTEATNFARTIRIKKKNLFDKASALSDQLQAMIMKYANSVQTESLSKETVCIVCLIRSASLLQGVYLMCERGMATNGKLFVKQLLENAFFLSALAKSHEDIVDYIHNSDKFSQIMSAQILIQNELISPEHPDFQEITKLSDVRENHTPSMKTISSLSHLKDVYAYFSLTPQNSLSSSDSSTPKYALDYRGSKNRAEFRPGPSQDHEITKVLGTAITVGLDIALVGATIFNDSESNQFAQHMLVEYQSEHC